MTRRPALVLHRNDAAREPLVGHVKATREDWLNVARDILVTARVAEVKVLAIGKRLDVSRSSFHWYFKSRKELLNALIDDWEVRNTRTIIAHVSTPADNINFAFCAYFRCFLNDVLFDKGLDFSVREWSRHDGSVRKRIDLADTARLDAMREMFERFDYPSREADALARILYFMQLGHNALDQTDPMEQRLARLDAYLLGFTGHLPDVEETDWLRIALLDGLED